MEKVRIQDDLYEFVNAEWLETAVIPDDKPSAGGFAELQTKVEQTLMGDFAKMAETNEYPNTYMKNAVRLYDLARDAERRGREGIRPALADLNRIRKLKDVSSLNRRLAEFVTDDLPLPFSIDVDADMKDTSRHCVMLYGPSVILPDTTYYKEEMAQQKEAMLGMWSNMVRALMSHTRLSAEEKEQYVKDALAFDERLAKLVKSSEEWSEYPKMYNPMKTRTVSSLMKPLKFRKLLTDLFGEAPETVIIAEPRYFKSFSEVFNEETFEEYKHWAYINQLIGASSLLSEKMREEGTSFRRALTGVAQVPAVDKFAYYLASGLYSEPVGLYYGDTYFGKAAKKDITSIVKEIIETYKLRVAKNDFLSDATKEKAILKLSKIVIKMGYPDKCGKVYRKMTFGADLSLYDAVCTLNKVTKLDRFSKLSEPADRTEWVMPGHMVNACYNPFTNDITFPAAILQPPFYSINQTRSENLGGIGAVIGHEISHAFDNNGAQCDENGNLKNWWTKEDNKKFIARTKAMIKEFEGIELPWGKVNATFIVSENIADNGGMAVTLEMMSRLDGASYEEYFINWAKVWCMKARPEYLALALNVDVHAPNVLRANMPPRNFDEWYTTFGATKKDKMYIAPSKRVVIW
ncbi:MAG: M13 family metallopeptidase [Clostridia bacterium]|nr:M13 family metallopeptidase [Clostridia bacterium]